MTDSASIARRASPLHHALSVLKPAWTTFNDMQVARSFSGETDGAAAALGVADVSAYSRVGLKGPGAVEWLRAQGVSVPPNANQWMPLGAHGLIARLGRTEFLVEDETTEPNTARLRAALAQPAPGVYPVPRSDCALVLTGNRVNELFVQTCNIDFSAQRASDHIVTLTQMVGVSVTVLRETASAENRWRVWCDGTFGSYLWETLIEIAKELGGGPMGLQRVSHTLARSGI